ncbi:MAG: hypothetical protein GX442_19940 [Candidatus Riflebacteria bacterium]|nr:hypothetical protein [Candidatus Riflebacteria bacterium]
MPTPVSLLPRNRGLRAVAAACLLLGALVLLAVPPVAARPRGSSNALAPRSLLSWKLPDGEATILKVDGKEYRFAPQSFWAVDGRLQFVNRFTPFLVEYLPGKAVPQRVTPLVHGPDRKLESRFFTDLQAPGPQAWLLEQSTATIRRADPDGAVDATWLLTDAQDAVITRFWPAGPAAFWLYDRARHLLMLRRCDAPPDPDADAPGADFPLSAESLAACEGHLVVADREGDADWVITRRQAGDAATEPDVLAQLEADEVRILDIDAAGTAFAYLRDGKGPALLRLEIGKDPVRLPLPGAWRFPADAGRVAQIVAAPGAVPSRLLVLLMRRPDEIALAEVALP